LRCEYLKPFQKFLEPRALLHAAEKPCVLLIDTNNVVRYLGHPAAVTTNTLQSLLKGSDDSAL
jgi:hypothetical protein